MENLLSERSNEDDPSVVLANAGLVRYGSTGSISSLGSNHLEHHHHHHQNQNLRGILTNGGGGPTRTYTPSSLYSQDSSSALPTTTTTSFGVGNRLSSTESVLIYDAIPKTTKTSLKKSNSRVCNDVMYHFRHGGTQYKIRQRMILKKNLKFPPSFSFILQRRMKTNILTLGIINSNTMGISQF